MPTVGRLISRSAAFGPDSPARSTSTIWRAPIRSLRDRPEPLSITSPSVEMPWRTNQSRTTRSDSAWLVSSGCAAASATPSDRYSKRA